MEISPPSVFFSVFPLPWVFVQHHGLRARFSGFPRSRVPEFLNLSERLLTEAACLPACLLSMAKPFWIVIFAVCTCARSRRIGLTGIINHLKWLPPQQALKIQLFRFPCIHNYNNLQRTDTQGRAYTHAADCLSDCLSVSQSTHLTYSLH